MDWVKQAESLRTPGAPRPGASGSVAYAPGITSLYNRQTAGTPSARDLVRIGANRRQDQNTASGRQRITQAHDWTKALGQPGKPFSGSGQPQAPIDLATVDALYQLIKRQFMQG